MKNLTKLALVLGLTTASFLSQTGVATARDTGDIFAAFDADAKKLSGQTSKKDKSGGKTSGGKTSGGKTSGGKTKDTSGVDLFSGFTLPAFDTVVPSKTSNVSNKLAEGYKKQRDASRKEVALLKKQVADHEAALEKANQDLATGKAILDRVSVISTVYNTDVVQAVQLLGDLMNTHNAKSGQTFYEGLGALLQLAKVDIKKPTAVEAKDSKMTGVLAAYAQAKKGIVEPSEMPSDEETSPDVEVKGKGGDAHKSSSSTSSEDSNDGEDVSEELRHIDYLVEVSAKLPKDLTDFQLPQDAYEKIRAAWTQIGLTGPDGLDDETKAAANRVNEVLKAGPKKEDSSE